MYMSPTQDPSSMCITSPLNRTLIPTDILEMGE